MKVAGPAPKKDQGVIEKSSERMEKLPSLRLFYALWPDAAARAALQRLQGELSLTGRRVPAENLHITLAFLGDRPSAHLPLLGNILKSLPPPALRLELNRLGYFRNSRIAWVGMHTVPETLTGLHDELIQALARSGDRYQAPGRFVPHVTLARGATALPENAFEPVLWETSQLVLVRSILEPDGSRYQVLATR